MVQIDKPFVRESGSWPFPNTITENICRYAGREGSAALFSAIGPWNNGGPVARKAIYYEPFTYWDWHGVPLDERFTNSRGFKRQLMWERQRGYRREDCDGDFGYPSPRARWQAFRTSIAIDPERRFWVKRIAVAHWMDEDDLNWIEHHLSELEGLDLSDTLVKCASSSKSKGASLPSVKMQALLAKLKWLGIPDVRAPGSEYMETFPLKRCLSMCTVLQALCIRDTHSEAMRPYTFASAEAASKYITQTVADIPASTANLELRMCQPWVDSFVAELVKQKPSVTHIGIDLGAWFQTYQPAANRVNREEIQNSVAAAAYKTVLDTYEEEHNKVLPAKSKWWLPNSLALENGRISQNYQVDRPNFARNWYGNERGGAQASKDQIEIFGNEGDKPTSAKNSHDRPNFTSLYENLFRLYQAGTSTGQGIVQFFPLTPEWQANSINAIHPLAMIQPKSNGKNLSTDQLVDMYDWLKKIFDWRPVIDWDYFMKPGSPDGQDAPIQQIAQQFQHMRDARIPIKILIGRRRSDSSSLYWGHDEAIWAQTLDKPFNDSMDQIAPLVDALIIHYDLRNPIDHERLEDIDQQEPYIGPTAVCPRSLCPWKRKDCPFEKQWDERPVATSTRITTNGSATTSDNSRDIPKHSPRLASSSISCLPTGVDADLQTLDDYDPANTEGEQTLHKLARHAAYLREAVGWQRFWTEYSPKLKNLSELHIRMPHAFDKVGSLRLRKLLDRRQGWKMHTFAAERQHMQTCEDLEWSIGRGDNEVTHLPEDKIWPGGRFVRRLWVRMDASPSFNVPALEGAIEAVPGPQKRASNSVLDNVSEYEIERIERKELERAIREAKLAAQREDDYQKSLNAARKRQTPAVDSTSEGIETVNIGSQEKQGTRRLSAQERRNRLTARQTWLVEMQGHAHNLSERNIETVIQHDLHRSSNAIKTIAGDAIQIREVLQNTRAELQRRVALCPNDVLRARITSSSLEDLVKQLDEKRARPMAVQLLEQERRKAAAKAKADAVADSGSPLANDDMADVPITNSESPETRKSTREIPETLPLPNDYVSDDQPGGGFAPNHLLGPSQPSGQPPETLEDSDVESLFGEPPEPTRPVGLPKPELAISPPNTAIETLEDSPVDLEDDDFSDNSNESGGAVVSRFPNTIPETLDVEHFNVNTQTVAEPVPSLGPPIIGEPHSQRDIPATRVINTQVEEVLSVEKTTRTATAQVPTHNRSTTPAQTTQAENQTESPAPEDILTSTEGPEVVFPVIRETPETPPPAAPQFYITLPPATPPNPSSQHTHPAPTKTPFTPRTSTPTPQTPPPPPPTTTSVPDKSARKRPRSTRSATPVVASRRSTRSVTPVSYVEVDSDEDGGEGGRKRRYVYSIRFDSIKRY
ncbi:hypothetical protein J1614_008293 [Plenodomus biglobosus]|nr:hypothetical protein J1614_008293 [Plenodomus biglobosus]